MEDNQIKELFAGFNPPLATSESEFMDRLERNMEAVRVVKEEISLAGKRSRRAAVFAAFAGFVVGVILTSLMLALSAFSIEVPYIGEFLSGSSISWAVIAAGTFFSALATYAMLREKPCCLKFRV